MPPPRRRDREIKGPSACISEETFSKAEPYGIMLRRDDAPFRRHSRSSIRGSIPKPGDRGDQQEVVRIAGPAQPAQFQHAGSSVLRNAFAYLSDSPDPARYER
jgi:glutamate/aspartate transport system substrate-binding protein